jgi:hypothetical protein
MANIVIKDLEESIELDRKAMAKIMGGKGRSVIQRDYRTFNLQRPRLTSPHFTKNDPGGGG